MLRAAVGRSMEAFEPPKYIAILMAAVNDGAKSFSVY
jgi:hypothetical protein